MDRRAVAGLGGAHQERIAERTAVHEQLGAPAGGPGIARTLGEAAHPDRPDGVVHRTRVSARSRPQTAASRRRVAWPGGTCSRVRPSSSSSNPMAGCASARVATTSTIARDSLAAGAEEFPARGRIEEEPPDGDGGSPLARRVTHRLDPAARRRCISVPSPSVSAVVERRSGRPRRSRAAPRHGTRRWPRRPGRRRGGSCWWRGGRARACASSRPIPHPSSATSISVLPPFST